MTTATTQRARIRPGIVALLAMLPLLMLLLYSIWSGYRDAIQLAETTSRNIAATLESRLGAVLRRTDGDQQDFLVTIPVDALNQQATPRYAQQVEANLDAHLAVFPEIIGVSVYDFDGALLYSSGRNTAQPTLAPGSEQFTALRDGASIGIGISDLIIDRASSRKFVMLARALEDNSGNVRGIVATSLDVDFLERSFSNVDLGTQGVVAVYRSDTFSRVARWPPMQTSPNAAMPADSQTRAAITAGRKIVTVSSNGSADGIHRIYTSHQLESYPFFVVVGVSRQEALAAWRLRSIATAAIVLGILALLACLLRRLWHNETVRNQYAAIIENSNDAIMSRALDGTILSWNGGAERMLGYSAAQAIGQSSRFCSPPERPNRLESNNAAVLRGEVVVRESDRITRDGRKIDVLTSHSPIRDDSGRVVGVSIILQDITARKQAQAQARLNEERTQGIVASAMDAIISLDSRHRIVLFNAAAEKLFGYRAEDVIGKPLTPLLPEHARAQHHGHIATFAATHDSTRSMENLGPLHGVRADGSEFPIEASISQTGSGEQKLFTVILRDISARLQAAATRASLEAQLRESQKMEAIGTLAGGIAHDFNNALATILGNTELARQDVRGNASALDSLEDIHKAATRARNLVQQILSFSRRQPTERVPIDLVPVISEAARLLRATLPAKLELDLACSPGMPLVLADASQIEQVLINLATNAKQAITAETGRITLRLDALTPDALPISRHPALSRLETPAAVRLVRITVSDTGIGMDAATRERIFDPFFTTKPKGEGTGLGLSVVHGIVQAHDGVITVDSEPGNGTTFAVYLPAAPATATVPAPEAPHAMAAPPSHGAAHVLYLDDNEALVSLVKRVLERRGYQVSAFTDQQAALSAVRSDPSAFDLVLTDYNMSGLSGLDVAEQVRAIRADLPVAVTSGFVDDELRMRAGRVGVRELIFKADDVKVFCDTVQRLVQSARTLTPTA